MRAACRQLAAEADANQRRVKTGLTAEQREERPDSGAAQWLPDLISAALWQVAF